MNKTIHHQSGSALISTLIVLTALLFSAIALVRTSTSSNTLVGNIQFKQGASSIAALGMYQSLTALRNIANKEAFVAGLYYPIQQPMDANGLPNGVNWATIPTVNFQNYSIQYVIERLCSGTLPVIDFRTQCSTGNSSQGASNKAGENVLANNNIYYRSTIRVVGPKNTLAFIQAILKQQ